MVRAHGSFIGSQFHFHVTTLGMCLCPLKYNLVLAKGQRYSVTGKVTVGLAESNGSLLLGLAD